MSLIKIIIYGAGGVAKELIKQIDCYNRIVEDKRTQERPDENSKDVFEGKGIKVLAFTETVWKGGYIEQIPVITIDECTKLQYDYVVIASAKEDEIKDIIEDNGYFDLQKVVKKDDFCPLNNGLNLSQINSLYFYSKEMQFEGNDELRRLYKEFENPDKFIDIYNRRRFIEKKEEIECFLNAEIFYDSGEQLKYVFVNDKKLYYPNGWSDKEISEYHTLNMYTCLSEFSAHRYLTPNFNVDENDVVADIGTAEGLFSLSIVDKVKKIYMFEVDEQWLKPLHATFKSYMDKIVIVNKFVSNINNWEFITCDQYFKDKEISLIKMDIEGEEQRALLGCKDILKRKNMRWLITTYHRAEDMEFIDAFMKINGYITERDENWLWIDYSVFGIKLFGEFRKAMLRAKNI